MNGIFSFKNVCPKKPLIGVTWSRKDVPLLLVVPL